MLNEKEKKDRITYLKNQMYGEGKLIIADNDMIPDTFAADMECIFGCNPETDIVRGTERGDEGGIDCTVVVVENDMSRKEIITKLSDYVNGLKLEYMLCAFWEAGERRYQYELDLDDEYVEGPIELNVTDIVLIDDCTNLLVEGVLELGMEGGTASDVAENIARGMHYTSGLYDYDDEKLI